MKPATPRVRVPRVPAATPAAAAPPQVAGLRFSTYVHALSIEIRTARSGERTKLKLMAHGAELLERLSFRDLNIDDVARAAGLAKGTFYVHFSSKEEFLLEVARRFLAFETTMALWLPSRTVFSRIRAMTEWYERGFALNAGVLRCIVQMSESNVAMRALWHARNQRMVDRQMEALAPDLPRVDPVLLRLALRTAGGLIDQSLFERHGIQVGPGRHEPDDPQLIYELHALLMYRATFACDPDPAELGPTRALVGKAPRA